jgi:hypothetical protein
VEYTDLIADFARRTVQNLDHVQEQGLRGNAGVFPVTQLWNSLLGLIVLPRERDMGRIPSTPMTQLWSQGWPRLTTAGTEHGTLHDFVTGLRNAVAHFNVEFIAGSDLEITSVKVWNQKYSRGRPTPDKRWEGRITVEELDRLARLVANLYVEKFASTTA